MLELHYVDRLKSKLSKVEINEKLRELTLVNKSWRSWISGVISRKRYYFYHTNFADDGFTLFYLPQPGRDILLPKLHGKVEEDEEGCIITLFYSGTVVFVFLFIIWSLFTWITVKASIINIICHLLFYFLGFGLTKWHCIDISKKVVNIMKQELDVE